MIRISSRLIGLAVLIASVGLVDRAAAQHYYVFDAGPAPGDNVDGSDFLAWQRGESSSSGLDDWQATYGANATAEIDIWINGQVLTAIIRNTSPDEDNYGGNPDSRSPSIVGFGFDVVGDSGASVGLDNWTLTTNKVSGDPEWLDQTAKWSDSNTDNLFEFMANEDEDGLYNPEATGGWAGEPAEPNNVIETILVATFDDTVNLVESFPEAFTPFVRFGNVGSAQDAQTFTVVGTLRVDPGGSGNHSPEPASVFVWTLGIATCVGMRMRRRWRSTRGD